MPAMFVTDGVVSAGFVAKDFQKHTATYRCFLNGASHHPPHTFRSIVYAECIRMRRLNKRDQDYLESLERLQKKWMVSGLRKNDNTHD